MIIHGQLTEGTVNEIRRGGGRDFELESCFIQTEGGKISSNELLILLYQAYGGEPFEMNISPSDTKPVTNLLHRQFLSDKLSG
jgi:hypothetical protein